MTFKMLVVTYLPSSLRSLFNRIENSPLGYRLAKGTFWSASGTVIHKGLTLVSFILVARILGIERFGMLGIIQSTVSMFVAFAGFGLGLTATKHVAQFRESEPERAGSIIRLSARVAFITGAISTLILYLSSDVLATSVLAQKDLSDLLKLASLLLLLGAIDGAQVGALSGFESFRGIAMVNFLVGLLTLPCMVFATLKAGLKGAVAALILLSVCKCFFNYLTLYKEARRLRVPLFSKGADNDLNVLWKFSVPAALAGAMVGPVTWFCHAMLVNTSNGFYEMGLFNAANQWFAFLVFLPSVLAQVLLPALSSQLSGGESRKAEKLVKYSILSIFLIILPIVILIMLFSKFIMGLYGVEFAGGWLTLTIIAVTAAIFAVQMPIAQVIAASGRMWFGFAINLVWAVIFLSLTYFFVEWGASGLAAARCVAYGVLFCCTIVFAWKYMQQQ